MLPFSGSPIANTRVSLSGLDRQVERTEQRVRRLAGRDDRHVVGLGRDVGGDELTIGDVGEQHRAVGQDVGRRHDGGVRDREPGLVGGDRL